MPPLSAEPIVLAAAHEQVLVRLVRVHTTPRKVAVGTPMTLLTAAGIGVGETARHWLHCWRNSAKATQVAQRLADAPRPGIPATFTPEQICAIVPSACEQPAEQSDLPLSH
jgi:hypothetical protein